MPENPINFNNPKTRNFLTTGFAAALKPNIFVAQITRDGMQK